MPEVSLDQTQSVAINAVEESATDPSTEQDSEPGLELEGTQPVSSEELEATLDLPSGRALTPNSAFNITRANHTRFVVLAGPIESGKTTLIATIYEMFQQGPFAGYLFAGSETLVDLETACHDSRLSSGRKSATTERTKRSSEYRLLHLRVRDQDLVRSTRDILFLDMTGEIFEDIQDSTEECKKHSILLRADHFALIIDGERLCDPFLRAQVVSDARLLLRRCIDSGMLGRNSFVDVIFSKADLLERSLVADRNLEAYLLKTQDEKFGQPLASRLANVEFSRVAARPDPSLGSSLQRGFGLAPLFEKWIRCGPRSRISESTVAEIETRGIREFDRYAHRYVGI